MPDEWPVQEKLSHTLPCFGHRSNMIANMAKGDYHDKDI
jgi:hypothetical protein